MKLGKKWKYQLASAIHAFQRNETHHKHCPPNYGEKKNSSLADELEGSPKSKKCIYVQKTLVVRYIHSRSIWWRQILQSLKFNFEKRSNSCCCPNFSNKMMKFSSISIKQQDKGMSN